MNINQNYDELNDYGLDDYDYAPSYEDLLERERREEQIDKENDNGF